MLLCFIYLTRSIYFILLKPCLNIFKKSILLTDFFLLNSFFFKLNNCRCFINDTNVLIILLKGLFLFVICVDLHGNTAEETEDVFIIY